MNRKIIAIFLLVSFAPVASGAAGGFGRTQESIQTPFEPGRNPDFNGGLSPFVSTDAQNAIEEAYYKVVGGNSGRLISFVFFNNGNTQNKWLGFASSSSPSNQVPYISPYNSTLESITFSNESDNANIDAEIYKNGVLSFTWQVRNKRYAWDSTVNTLNMVSGDRISLFFRKIGTGTTPTSPTVEVIFKVSDDLMTVGGSPTL